MSDFLNILDNHRELMSERGYDEIGLGSADEPGFFMKRLEYCFSNCIAKARHDNNKQDFFIEAYGFFDGDKDMVAFNFHYEFDPQKKDINLKSFSARMGDVKKTFFLPRNSYELPFASRVYAILREERDLQVSIPVQNVEKLVKQQDEYLKQIGYYDTLFKNPPDFIRDELKAKMTQIAAYSSSQVQHIGISRFIHFSQYDFIRCGFNYQYDPFSSKLSLESITAKKDDIERHFSLDATKHPLTLESIHKAIRDAERLNYAKDLSKNSAKKQRSQNI